MKVSYSITKKHSKMMNRAFACGFNPKLTNQFVSEVRKWETNSGVEWTVSRLKDLKTALLNCYSVKHDLVAYKAALTNCTSVRKTSSGHYAGIIGKLFSEAMSSERKFKAVVNLIMIYSAYVIDTVDENGNVKPTKKQVKKFFEAVSAVNKDGSTKKLNSPLWYHQQVSIAIDKLTEQYTKPQFLPAKPFRLSSNLKHNQEPEFYEQWYNYMISERGRSLTSYDCLTKTRGPLMQHCDPEKTLWNAGPCFSDIYNLFGIWEKHNDATMGELRVAQEHGCKARFYLDADKWVQESLEPLKQFLMNYMKQLPWDLTHGQRLADSIIQARLDLGYTCYCYDLQNASDCIPVDLQWRCWDSLLPDNPYVSLYKWVNADYARVNIPGIAETRIKWIRGQALGTGPSFASFAFLHGILLFILNDFKHDNKFFVVGDDVIILDDDLALLYEVMLEDLELDWSPNKTLKSNRIAEFTGMIYRSNQPPFNAVKWKFYNNKNVVDIISLLGLESLPHLVKSKAKQALVKLYLMLPEPVGAGYNPLGLSLDRRIELFESVLFKKRQRHLQTVIDLNEIENRRTRQFRVPHQGQKAVTSFGDSTLMQTLWYQDTNSIVGPKYADRLQEYEQHISECQSVPVGIRPNVESLTIELTNTEKVSMESISKGRPNRKEALGNVADLIVPVLQQHIDKAQHAIDMWDLVTDQLEIIDTSYFNVNTYYSQLVDALNDLKDLDIEPEMQHMLSDYINEASEALVII